MRAARHQKKLIYVVQQFLRFVFFFNIFKRVKSLSIYICANVSSISYGREDTYESTLQQKSSLFNCFCVCMHTLAGIFLLGMMCAQCVDPTKKTNFCHEYYTYPDVRNTLLFTIIERRIIRTYVINDRSASRDIYRDKKILRSKAFLWFTCI